MNEIVDNEEHHKKYYLSEEAIKQYYEQLFQGAIRHSGNNPENCVFILINRKGYWDYKILIDDENIDCRVYSDRKLDKASKETLHLILNGKYIIIYDDSLSNGSNLFYYYLLCKVNGAKCVSPVVYALNVDFPSENSRKLMRREAKRITEKDLDIDEQINQFENQLSYKIILNASDIDKMSIWQTQLFQKYVSPLVMDLPIFNHISGIKDNKIEMTEEQFDLLTHVKNEEWQFILNNMRGWGKDVKASYFKMKTPLTEEKSFPFFHDFVVKCKYETEDGKVRIVFTPFAIVKSMEFEQIYQIFQLFYQDTIYGKNIIKNFENKSCQEILSEDHGICRGMFRSIIYQLSDYIGKKFQKFVKQTLGIKIEYDWNMMKENLEEDFILLQESIYKQFDEKAFLKKIYPFKGVYGVEPIYQIVCVDRGKVLATQERVNNFVRERIIEKKRKPESRLRERIYTFETLKADLEEQFIFESESAKQTMITNVSLVFLETNSFSNFLMVDNERGIIYRGFRHGENSEIFLHEDLWFFYAHLYVYYERGMLSVLVKKYDQIMQMLELYLKQKKYFGIWISIDGFYFLKKYFAKFNERELLYEIQRRRYLLKNSDIEGGERRQIMINIIKNTTIQWSNINNERVKKTT